MSSEENAHPDAITRAGLKALEEKTERWRQMSGVLEKLLAEET
jgi:PadR family transcriptional regulator PadR